MSLLAIDSCGDTYSTAELALRWDIVTDSPTVLALGGRRDSSGIQLSGIAQAVEKQFTGAATIAAGVAFKTTNNSGVANVLEFREGATIHVTIEVTTLGAIRVIGPGGELGISDNGLVEPGFYNYLEVSVLVSDTGRVIVNFNSNEILDLTPVDTNNAGAVPEIDNVRLEGGAGAVTIDDFYVTDTVGAAPQNGFLSDTAIVGLVPIADGATTDWTVLEPVTPTTHFDKVDEIPPDDDTTFVASEGPNQIDLFEMDALPDPGGVSSIHGLQFLLYAKKTKIPAKQITPIIRSNAVNFLQSVISLTSSYLYYNNLLQQDPDTSADWTESGVNSAEFGAQV